MPRVTAPAHLRIANGRGNGTDSGGRKVKPPPAFKRLPPEPPIELGDYGEDVWRRIVPELNRLELIKPIDAESLAAYCQTCQLWYDAQRVVFSEGINLERQTATGDPQIFANPAVDKMLKASADMRAWAVQFGLTPASENNLRPGKADDDDNAASFS